MAYTKTVADADVYFRADTHLKASSWNKHDDDTKKAALAHAQRVLEMHLGRDADDPASTDRYRWDYAIFEQALFMIEDLPREGQDKFGLTTRGSVSAKDDDYKGGEVRTCVEAERFLGLHRRRLVRA